MARKYLRSRETLEAVEERRLQVAHLQRECKYLENRCTSATRSYTAKIGGTGDPHKVLWDELADKRSLLQLHRQALEREETTVSQWIELLPNPRWRMLLRCRYLEGMDLQDVLEELERATGRSFSMNQIYRLHSRALDAAEALWPMQ